MRLHTHGGRASTSPQPQINKTRDSSFQLRSPGKDQELWGTDSQCLRFPSPALVNRATQGMLQGAGVRAAPRGALPVGPLLGAHSRRGEKLGRPSPPPELPAGKGRREGPSGAGMLSTNLLPATLPRFPQVKAQHSSTVLCGAWAQGHFPTLGHSGGSGRLGFSWHCTGSGQLPGSHTGSFKPFLVRVILLPK